MVTVMGKNRGKGFTLLELLTVIAVVAILGAFAVPSLDAVNKRNRIVSVTNDLIISYQLARDEALLRGRRVAVCRRSRSASENATCTQSNLGTDAHCSCATGTADTSSDGWEDGWLVFVDSNQNSEADSDETLIRVFDPVASSFTVRGNSPHQQRVYFDADGTSIAGSVWVCEQGDDTDSDSQRIRNARRVLMSRIGQSNILNGTECGV